MQGGKAEEADDEHCGVEPSRMVAAAAAEPGHGEREDDEHQRRHDRAEERGVRLVLILEERLVPSVR